MPMFDRTTTLDAPETTMGIAAGRPSYLVFRFASSAFLGGSSSSISYDTLLTPRRGSIYDVRVCYVDNIYGVAISDSAGRELERRRLRACPAS